MTLLRLEFTNTFEDYREANLAIGTGQRPRRGPNWVAIVLLSLAGLLITLFLVGLFVGRSRATVPIAPPAPTPTTLESILISLIPWMVVFGGVFLVFFRSPKNQGNQLRGNLGITKPRAPIMTRMGVWAVIGCTILALIYLLGGRDGNTLAWGNAVPWLVVGTAMFVLFRRMGRNAVCRAWEGQPQLQREQVVEFREDHLLVADSLVRHEYDWRALPAFRESPNLILIHPSDFHFIMVPKRAFADEAQLDTCRQILQSKIGDPTQAFPVLPVAPLPLPVGNPVDAEQSAQ